MNITRVLGVLFCLSVVGCDPGTPPDAGPLCGGFAGIECPGAGQCVDAPGDGCDPNHGGADCGGVCQCNALGLCEAGSHWDASPSVCGCVADTSPCAAVLCPVGTQCVVEDGKASCVGGEPCGDAICGPGRVCCNPSCGICTPPDGACIQIACD
jgi:hypothetical protein